MKKKKRIIFIGCILVGFLLFAACDDSQDKFSFISQKNNVRGYLEEILLEKDLNFDLIWISLQLNQLAETPFMVVPV